MKITPQELLKYAKAEYVAVAMDESGLWSLHDPMPRCVSEEGVWICETYGTCKGLDIDYDGDWKDSLHIREITFADLEWGEKFTYDDHTWLKCCDDHAFKESGANMYFGGSEVVERLKNECA